MRAIIYDIFNTWTLWRFITVLAAAMGGMLTALHIGGRL